MQEIMDEAVENYRRKVFLEGLSEDFRLLREDEEAWKDHESEMEAWDSTAVDGLEDE